MNRWLRSPLVDPVCRHASFAIAILLFIAQCALAAPSGVAYVANAGNDSVSVVSLTSQSVINTIPVGDGPHYIAFNPAGSRAYVTNFNADTVSVIDTSSQMVINTFNVGDQPEQIVVTKDGAKAYVANQNSASISVIDLATNSVSSFGTAPNPFSLALHPTRNELWIGFGTTGTLIEARSLATNALLGQATGSSRIYASGGLAFWPDGSMAIGSESCGFCGRFHELSGNIVGGTISPIQNDILYDNQGAARGVAVNSTNNVAYLAKLGQNGGSHRVIEFGGLGRTLFSGDPRELAVAPNGQYLFLTELTSGGANPGSVAVIDANSFSIVNTIPVGLTPQGIAIQPVPEPGALALVLAVGAAIGCWRHRRSAPFKHTTSDHNRALENERCPTMSQRPSLLILFIVIGSLAAEQATASTIAAAKALPLGSVVTLNSVVIANTTDLVNSNVSSSFIVQDSTGGSGVFGSNADIATLLTGLSAGDRINVTGTTASFSGLFQLVQPSLSTSLVTAAVGIPAPVVTTTADYQDFSPTAELLESRLVSLANVHFTGIVPGQTFAGATNYTISDGVNDVLLRIQTTGISLIGDPIPTGQVNLSGVFSQFDFANPLPGVSGVVYEILPLDDSSITLVPEPGTCILASMVAAVTALTIRARQPRGSRRDVAAAGPSDFAGLNN